MSLMYPDPSCPGSFLSGGERLLHNRRMSEDYERLAETREYSSTWR